MTPQQWARVFDSGAVAALAHPPGTQDFRAVLTDVLQVMAGTARKISLEPGEPR